MKLFVILGVFLMAVDAYPSDNLLLPDPLKSAEGMVISSSEQWQAVRRAEILELFRTHVYGRTPVGRPTDLRFETKEITPTALSGSATLKLVNIRYSGAGGEGMIELSVFIPNAVPKPVPGFLLICNRSRENIDHTRENKSPFWPVEWIIERGYVAAAFLNADVDPDKDDGFQDGVHGIFDSKNVPRSPDAWGTIAAWAWGASRVMDYLETDEDVDATRMAAIGHSRGGKTALWCGAEDQRFSMAISNNSGCTGAAIARRKQGESIEAINRRFPHWFCANYKEYNDKEDELPVDQHELVALMAPRLVYVASATEDNWADPMGEFLACVHATPVYSLFGLTGLNTDEMPKPEHPLHDGHIGYHLRTGGHGLTEYDWNCYMDFADKHWK
ncbi:MAG TPA: prolyl oligopeptidase family serine peptidase [bacterium]|nr:prolyl oligopeptidase family serine peptidase [bacterium]